MSGRTTSTAQGTPNTPVPESSSAAAPAANISISAMITDRLQDIAVTNSLRHRRRKRIMMMTTTTTSSSSSSSSSRAEDVKRRRSQLLSSSSNNNSNKRRERTRSYQRYKLSSLTLKAMKMRMGRRERGGRKSDSKGTDITGGMLLQRTMTRRSRRVLRRPSNLQSLSPALSIQGYQSLSSSSHPTVKRPYTVLSSHISHPIISNTTDTPLVVRAHLTDTPAIAHPYSYRCYRLSTHIWHAKRMTMQRLICRSPGGSPEQRCVYVPCRHRGRGLKAVLKVISNRSRSDDDEEEEEKKKKKKKGADSGGGVSSKVCMFLFTITMTME